MMKLLNISLAITQSVNEYDEHALRWSGFLDLQQPESLGTIRGLQYDLPQLKRRELRGDWIQIG